MEATPSASGSSSSGNDEARATVSSPEAPREASSSLFGPGVPRQNDDENDDDDDLCLLDGGTGEELFRRGLVDPGRTLWSVAALVHDTNHELLKHVHTSFLHAGCHCVTTNSYGITATLGFTDHERLQYASLSGRLAREAVREHQQQQEQQEPRRLSRRHYRVLGSLGPMVESYRPDLILERSKGMEAYRPLVQGLYPWVDAFLVETMGCVEEATQAMEAIAQEHGRRRRQQQQQPRQPIDDPSTDTQCDDNAARPLLHVWVSFTLGSEGKLRDGTTASDAVMGVLDASTALFCDPSVRLSALLFNCCEPEAVTAAVRNLHGYDRGADDAPSTSSCVWERLRRGRVRLGAYANRLTAVSPDWTYDGSSDPQPLRNDLDAVHYGDFVRTWITDYHVTIVGGCCGITPEHIQFLHDCFYASQDHA